MINVSWHEQHQDPDRVCGSAECSFYYYLHFVLLLLGHVRISSSEKRPVHCHWRPHLSPSLFRPQWKRKRWRSCRLTTAVCFTTSCPRMWLHTFLHASVGMTSCTTSHVNVSQSCSPPLATFLSFTWSWRLTTREWSVFGCSMRLLPILMRWGVMRADC